MVAAGFGLPAKKPMATPRQKAGLPPYQSQVPMPGSLQEASGIGGNREYQSQIPRPNSLEDATRGSVGGPFNFPQSGIQTMPFIPGQVVGGGLNKPDANGQYGAITADQRMPGHPGFRPGIDDRTPSFQPLAQQGPPRPPGAVGFPVRQSQAVHPQNQGMIDLSNQLNAPRDPNRQPLSPAPNVSGYRNAVEQNGLLSNAQAAPFMQPGQDAFGLTGTAPTKTVGGSWGQPGPAQSAMNNAASVNYQDQARTQFNLPTSAGSGATPNLMGGGTAFGGAAVRPIGGTPTFVDAQPNTFDFRSPEAKKYAVGSQEYADAKFGKDRYKADGTGRYEATESEKSTRRNYAASAEGQANTKRLAENAARTKAARETSLASRRANVTANAQERRSLRQERIAQKKNPQVANRFFGNQQELAMQGLRNQGALGVAKENAKGEIAGKEALAEIQKARIGVEAAKAGVPNPFGLAPGASAPKAATEAPAGSGAELAGQPDDVVQATLAGLPPETQKRVLEEKRVAELPFMEQPAAFPFTAPGARTRGEAIQSANDMLRPITGPLTFGILPGMVSRLTGRDGLTSTKETSREPARPSKRIKAAELKPTVGDTPEQARARARLKKRGYGR